MKHNDGKKSVRPDTAHVLRRLGVVIERVDGKVDTLVEGHKTLDTKIDNLREEMNERFKEVDYKFGVVFDELRLIRHELKEKVGREEFLVLEKRVAALERPKNHK